MNVQNSPSVRLQSIASGGEHIHKDTFVLDLPPSNKFSVSRPSEPRGISAPYPMQRPTLNSSEAETDTSENDSSQEHVERARSGRHSSSSVSHGKTRLAASPESNVPRFRRSLSMPLPSQLHRLQNPHRPSLATSSQTSYSISEESKPDAHVVEMGESLQTMIQTMLQVSPPQVFDPTKEQYSACSLSIPATTMSALFTIMKNMNYVSANASAFKTDINNNWSAEEIADSNWSLPMMSEFDIGELLQSIGDALSGVAGQVGTDLVMYHGDAGIKHVNVRGNEAGISFALFHIIRQVLATTQPGDSIELGLIVEPTDSRREQASTSWRPQMSSIDEYRLSSSPVDLDSPFRCTIRISHKFGTSSSVLDQSDNDSASSSAMPTRPEPSFSTIAIRRLLRQIGATLTPDLPPPQTILAGRTYELSLTLEYGSLSAAVTPAINEIAYDEELPGEPTLEQLNTFSEGLRGKRVTLHASSKGSFAQHLTSYLTTWGMDVSHLSPEDSQEELSPGHIPSTDFKQSTAPLSPNYPVNGDGYISSGVPVKSDERQPGPQPLSFIFIDDDIQILRARLHALRLEHPYHMNLNIRKRPSLKPHHRPRSSPQIPRAGFASSTSAPPSVVVLHFTSLSNYKLVKDVIQSAMALYSGSSVPLPEVMIIPKPVGPRRLLTALHTAITKPVVDPFFEPIATSPLSPSVRLGGFFQSEANGNSPGSPLKSHRPSGSRSNSDRSTKSTTKEFNEHTNHIPPPSPLSMSENVEYFSEAAVKLGTSASSGLVIQSPDGQPAGIFFHPRSKNSKNSSSYTMDKTQLAIPTERKRATSRATPDGVVGSVSFSALHEVAGSPSSKSPGIGVDTRASSSSRVSTRKQASPRAEEFATVQVASPSASRRQSGAEKTTTPLGSPTGETAAPGRRTAVRRPGQESKDQTPANAVKKGKVPDNHIVPPISVLIVDDNPINQTILSTFMKKKKIKYDLASNGQEAVQKWRTGEFHLILMDIQMPIMDGIQATKEIRRLEKSNEASAGFPGTPSVDENSPSGTPSEGSSESKSTSTPYRSSVIIVALTASSLQSDRVAALAAGCNDFLTKPVSLLWLNNKIIEWGSIKALQMWADLRPEVVKNLSSGQAVKARSVAERLHVPRGRITPVPSRPPSVPLRTPPLNGPTEALPPNTPFIAMTSTSSAFWDPNQASPTVFWETLGGSAEVVSNGTNPAQTEQASTAELTEEEALSAKIVASKVMDDDGTPTQKSQHNKNGYIDILTDSKTPTAASFGAIQAPVVTDKPVDADPSLNGIRHNAEEPLKPPDHDNEVPQPQPPTP